MFYQDMKIYLESRKYLSRWIILMCREVSVCVCIGSTIVGNRNSPFVVAMKAFSSKHMCKILAKTLYLDSVDLVIQIEEGAKTKRS